MVEPLDEKLRRYAEEKPWGDGPDWFLWSFTEAGRRRSRELEALYGDPTGP